MSVKERVANSNTNYVWKLVRASFIKKKLSLFSIYSWYQHTGVKDGLISESFHFGSNLQKNGKSL